MKIFKEFYLLLWGPAPKPPGFSALGPKYDVEKKQEAAPKMRPPYFGLSSGAQVAPQRCPILRKDENKITDKTDYASFFNKINLLGEKGNGNFNCR